MYKTVRFTDMAVLDNWLNDQLATVGPFEIVGYQALWLGSALGTEITVTVKYNVFG